MTDMEVHEHIFPQFIRKFGWSISDTRSICYWLKSQFSTYFFFFFFLIAQFVIILSPANNYLLKVKNTLENAVKYSQS